MNRADNQHRKRAIELLREDILMADGPNEMFIGDFPCKDHVEAIVDAIMDAVNRERDGIGGIIRDGVQALREIPVEQRTSDQEDALQRFGKDVP